MTLSLTNRVKNLKLLFLFIRILLFCCLMDVFFPKIYATGCNNHNFDVTTSASMGEGIKFDNEDTVYIMHSLPPYKIDTILPTKKTINPLYLKKIDTLDIIISNYLGHGMMVDQAEQVKQIFFRITKELRTDTTLRK